MLCSKPVYLQDGPSPEWTCPICCGDLLWCGHYTPEESAKVLDKIERKKKGWFWKVVRAIKKGAF